jgi:hypothetical protein
MKTDAHPSRRCRTLKAALTLGLLVVCGQIRGDEVRVERVGQWPGWPRGDAYGVAVSGHYAYVAVGDAGLQVIDVSDPAHPRRVGGYNTSGWAHGVAVSGHYAYVADGDEGLQVIDVSDPANPRWVGGYDTPGSAEGVAVSGDYAYVADGGWGLQILRIGDAEPPAPRLDGPFGLTAEGFAAWLNAPVAGTYRVETSGDLRTWETLVTLTNVTGRARVLDPAATSAAQRFYRAVRVP